MSFNALQFKNSVKSTEIQPHPTMISLPPSHSSLNATQILDLKSREYLTNLLDHQIDRNEMLESENMRLQNEQKKLIELLERKSAEIAKLRISKTDKTKTDISSTQKFENIKSNQSKVAFSKQFVEQTGHQSQKVKNNDSTALFQNTTMSETNNEMIEVLKHNIQEKQEQMKKMREYYTKCLQTMENQKTKIGEQYQKDFSSEIQQYRSVVGKQKNRIKELMNELQKNQEEKSAFEAQVLKLKAKKSNTDQSQSKTIKQLQSKLSSLEEKHQAELQTIEQIHQEQKQALLHAHSQEIETLQKNTIYKIQQIQQKSEKQSLSIHQIVEAKEKQIDQLNKECYNLQSKLKEQLVRFEQQCEIVMNIEHDREKMIEKITKLEEDIRNKQEDKEIEEIKRVNIDNIHKQYNSKLEEKDKLLNQSTKALNQSAKQLQHKNQNIEKLQQKLEENTKKYTQQIYGLEMQTKKYKEELQTLREENQYLQKQNKLKEEDNKRLVSKVNKQSQKKEQYVKKLEEKVAKLEGQLTQNETLMQEKEDDVLKYREQMQNLIQRLKTELMKKDNQLIMVFKQNEKKVKEMKQIQEQYEVSAAGLHNQYQQASKKYTTVCDRLRIVEEEKSNFKNLYEEVLKQLRGFENKNNKLSQENERLRDENDNMQKQIDCLKEDILSNNLNQSEKEELTKLRNEAYDQKARINKLTQNINRFKDENQKALRENISLVDKLNDLQGQNTKMINQLQLKREKIEQYEDQIRALDEQLRERCKQLETSMPYVNKILEEKKANQLELQRKNNEIKKLMSLVEKAKLMKAEEITNLNRELEFNTQKINTLLGQIKDNRDVIERFNREKVNMLRQNTVREDLLKKYQKQNKVLKQNLKQSQEHVEQLMHYLGVADSAMENVELQQSFQRKSQRK